MSLSRGQELQQLITDEFEKKTSNANSIESFLFGISSEAISRLDESSLSYISKNILPDLLIKLKTFSEANNNLKVTFIRDVMQLLMLAIIINAPEKIAKVADGLSVLSQDTFANLVFPHQAKSVNEKWRNMLNWLHEKSFFSVNNPHSNKISALLVRAGYQCPPELKIHVPNQIEQDLAIDYDLDEEITEAPPPWDISRSSKMWSQSETVKSKESDSDKVSFVTYEEEFLVDDGIEESIEDNFEKSVLSKHSVFKLLDSPKLTNEDIQKNKEAEVDVQPVEQGSSFAVSY